MSASVGRRAFLGSAAAAAGALAAIALAPLSARALGRPDRHGGVAPSVASPARHGGGPASGEAWDIDDMWGHAPRYADRIPHAPARTSPVAWEHVDPIDRMLVI